MISLLTKYRSYSVFGLLMAGMPGTAFAAWDLNLMNRVTPFSRSVYDLHLLILWICTVIGVIVFGAMFYSIWKFRKLHGAVTANWHESTAIEVAWTILPLVVLVGMAVPATKALIMMEDEADAYMTIKVIGYQSKWHYEYIDDGISFDSSIEQNSNEARALNSSIDSATVEKRVVVPVNKKIRFLTTASDATHTWLVTGLSWKLDAVPGFIDESWLTVSEKGVYGGECIEPCGKDRSFMPVVVEALSEEDYIAWVARMKAKAVN
jgi:cytochrome c oxidase subunit 2